MCHDLTHPVNAATSLLGLRVEDKHLYSKEMHIISRANVLNVKCSGPAALPCLYTPVLVTQLRGGGAAADTSKSFGALDVFTSSRSHRLSKQNRAKLYHQEEAGGE